jgi:hypothetical protein
MQGTVGNAIRDAIAKLGENIVLQSAVSVVHDPVPRLREDLGLRVAWYTHGGVSPSRGHIGALALISLKSQATSLDAAAEGPVQLQCYLPRPSC